MRTKRAGSRLRRFGTPLMVALLLACTPLPRHPRPEEYVDPGSGFSGRLAEAHIDALRGIGPRLPGTRNDRIARGYLAREFRSAGAEPRELVYDDRRHLIAELDGASRDVVLLVSAYSVLGSGDWVDDTGVGVLLELARVFGSTKPPYTLGFALAETRPLAGIEAHDGSPMGWRRVETMRVARNQVTDAGRALATAIEARGESDRVRAIIVFDFAASGRLRFVRDLRSHPGFRKVFWDSAADLGRTSMFPRDGEWAAPSSLHLGFREGSMDRVLALVGVAPRGMAPLGIVPLNADFDSIVPEGSEARSNSLSSFGGVAVEALSRLMRRFEKVDAFSG